MALLLQGIYPVTAEDRKTSMLEKSGRVIMPGVIFPFARSSLRTLLRNSYVAVPDYPCCFAVDFPKKNSHCPEGRTVRIGLLLWCPTHRGGTVTVPPGEVSDAPG